MVLKYVFAALVLMSLAFAGCSSNRTGKDVAALRVSGKLEQARDLAVGELNKKPNALALWGELAATDAALAETRTTPDVATASRYLMEAAVICTAVSSQQGKLDEKWQFAAAQTARLTVALADKILNGVKVETPRGHTHLKATPLSDVELETERFIDPNEMETAVRNAAPLIFFARQLGPVLSKDIGSSVDDLEKRLAQIGENTNISERQLDGRCRVYTERAAQCLEAAAQDLKDLGYFQSETILDNPILE